MNSRIKHLIYFIILGLLPVIPDQLTKALAVREFKDAGPVPVINAVLYFLYVENRGAAFGMLIGQQIFFYLITVFVVIFILRTVYRMPYGRYYLPLRISLGMIFGGALGNFIDRIRNQYVVDFIYFSPINFPVFNVADIFVTVGCFLLIILFFFFYKDEDFEFLRRQKPIS